MIIGNAAKASLYTALWTFIGTFTLTAAGWLQDVAEWASTSGRHPLPGLSTVGYAAVSALVAASGGIVTFIVRAAQAKTWVPGQGPTYEVPAMDLDAELAKAYATVDTRTDDVGPHGVNRPNEQG